MPLLMCCESADTVNSDAKQVVEVTMREYSFEVAHSLPAGRVVFRFSNAGSELHSPGLVALDAGAPQIDAHLRSTDRGPITPFAGVNPRLPGASGTFAVELDAGQRYALVCFLRTTTRESHAEKGMVWEGRAGPYAAGGSRGG